MDRKKLLGAAAIVLGAAVLGAALLAGKGKDGDGRPEESAATPMTEVPDASIEAMPASKSEAYQNRKETIGTADIQDYWDTCLPVEKKADSSIRTAAASPKGSGTGRRISESDFLSESSQQTGKASGERGYNPYAETPLQRERRHQRRQEEAIRLAERMQGGDTTGETAADEPVLPQTVAEDTVVITRSGVISSMDAWDEGSTLTSLDDVPQQELPRNEKPLRCMFARTCKVRSGQRVPVILLEDIVVSGVLIPRNTHIMATANIRDRLELEFSSVEKGGRILHLGYEAYDNDGSKGIYCPDVGNARNTVRRRGANIISSGLNSRVGRVAGDIVSTGVSIFQDADGKTSVTIPSGYTFLILKKKTY